MRLRSTAPSLVVKNDTISLEGRERGKEERGRWRGKERLRLSN